MKWAKLFGIRRSVAEFANRLIDNPKNISLTNGSLRELIGRYYVEDLKFIDTFRGILRVDYMRMTAYVFNTGKEYFMVDGKWKLL